MITPGPNHRLRAELYANLTKLDTEPVIDSSLTYGDLRAFDAMLNVNVHKLADMLGEREPNRLIDDGDTEMTITVDSARRIAWALTGSTVDRDDILGRIRRAVSADGEATGPSSTSDQTNSPGTNPLPEQAKSEGV